MTDSTSSLRPRPLLRLIARVLLVILIPYLLPEYTWAKMQRQATEAEVVYTYDALAGWVSQIGHRQGNDNILSLTYARDRTGLIEGIVEKQGLSEDVYTWTYGYDDLKRLKEATRKDASEAVLNAYEYTYDRNGNRLSKTFDSTLREYTYNNLDQLTGETVSSETRAYEFDPLGRLIKEYPHGSANPDRVYTWSVDDRLLSVKLGGATENPVVSYTYDSSGTRVARSAPGEDGQTWSLVDYQNPTATRRSSPMFPPTPPRRIPTMSMPTPSARWPKCRGQAPNTFSETTSPQRARLQPPREAPRSQTTLRTASLSELPWRVPTTSPASIEI